jgi:hypothetical protein
MAGPFSAIIAFDLFIPNHIISPPTLSTIEASIPHLTQSHPAS